MSGKAERLTLTVPELAEALGINRVRAYELTRIAGFPAIRISNKRIIIPRAALSRWLEEQTATRQ